MPCKSILAANLILELSLYHDRETGYVVTDICLGSKSQRHQLGSTERDALTMG